MIHTHSKAATLLSMAGGSGVALAGYELLKGLSGVTTHDHREWLPIVPNRQDWEKGEAAIEEVMRQNPGAHGFLIRGHGLYTWGVDLGEAFRHLEALEFLLECVLHREAVGPSQSED